MHVPGWHQATLDLQEQGRVQMVGIVQEQHGDRARLFMQWKQMGWPILVDALGELDVPYVPITLLIDEEGVIARVVEPFSQAGTIVEEFAFATAPPAPPARAATRVRGVPDAPGQDDAPSAWMAYGNELAKWGGVERLGEAADAFEAATAVAERADRAYFRRGVVMRMRYDSPAREPGDFQRAVAAWQHALEIAPNNYIYRRRIQQYGPRLDKPYSFYDWIHEARDEIRARGEQPEPLRVEPAGAEFAYPGSDADTTDAANPDPEGRIARDDGLIEIETVVVPATGDQTAARVHVVMRPNPARDAHWNNEAGDLVLWVDPPPGWSTPRRRHELESPRGAATSAETRRVEFELRAKDKDAGGAPANVRAYVLYYVCEGASGACLYRRQDLTSTVDAGKTAR